MLFFLYQTPLSTVILVLKKKWPAIELERRLRWADVDATGRLHFPRVFEIIEEAEAELLRSGKWEVDFRKAKYEFPRVYVQCSFRQMIFHDEYFLLNLAVGKLGRSSIRYDFTIRKSDGELAIHGNMTVAVLRSGRLVPVPAALRKILQSRLERDTNSKTSITQ